MDELELTVREIAETNLDTSKGEMTACEVTEKGVQVSHQFYSRDLAFRARDTLTQEDDRKTLEFKICRLQRTKEIELRRARERKRKQDEYQVAASAEALDEYKRARLKMEALAAFDGRQVIQRLLDSGMAWQRIAAAASFSTEEHLYEVIKRNRELTVGEYAILLEIENRNNQGE